VKASGHSTSNVPLRLLAFYGGALVVLFLLFALAAYVLREINSSRVPIPDEKAVAQQLLEQKLSGPHYFEIGEPSAELPHPYITPASARAQFEHIATERKLDATQRAKLETVIKALTEPSPSRMVGTERLNALKLNLALDALE
jgi:hypothetical protein